VRDVELLQLRAACMHTANDGERRSHALCNGSTCVYRA
jgi:hypothetical protein